MLKKIKEFLLNTPEKYWLIAFGYHFHKSSVGTLLIGVGIIASVFWSFCFGSLLIIVGCVLIALSIGGQVYVYRKFRLELWEKYKK